MTDVTTNPSHWRPGVSGNPNGRPVGSRNAFSNAFMEDLSAVWAQHGRSAMELTAKTMPSVFFATAARVLPKDVALTIEQLLAADARRRGHPARHPTGPARRRRSIAVRGAQSRARGGEGLRGQNHRRQLTGKGLLTGQ